MEVVTSHRRTKVDSDYTYEYSCRTSLQRVTVRSMILHLFDIRDICLSGLGITVSHHENSSSRACLDTDVQVTECSQYLSSDQKHSVVH